MYYYVTIKPGEFCEIHETQNKEIEYETLRDAVQGYIEALNFNIEGNRLICWIDEEGKLKSNMKPCINSPYGVIMGPCCITGQDDEDTVGFSKEVAEKVKVYFDKLCCIIPA